MAKAKREPNVILVEPDKGWYPTFRENPPGEPLRFAGTLVHLCEMRDGELCAIELPDVKALDAPDRVYRARYWPEVKQLFGTKHTFMEKLDRGLWLGALGILGFLVFLLVASLMG